MYFPQSNEYIYRFQHKSSTNKSKLSTTVNRMSIKRSSGIYYLKTSKQDSIIKWHDYTSVINASVKKAKLMAPYLFVVYVPSGTSTRCSAIFENTTEKNPIQYWMAISVFLWFFWARWVCECMTFFYSSTLCLRWLRTILALCIGSNTQ